MQTEISQLEKWLATVLEGQGSILGRNMNSSPCHQIQTGSGAHPVSYLMYTTGKAAGAWSWIIFSPYFQLLSFVELYLLVPIHFRVAVHVHRGNFDHLQVTWNKFRTICGPLSASWKSYPGASEE
jgi:hypothetical protein